MEFVFRSTSPIAKQRINHLLDGRTAASEGSSCPIGNQRHQSSPKEQTCVIIVQSNESLIFISIYVFEYYLWMFVCVFSYEPYY